LVLFFKKELLVFTYFFNFWTAWELPVFFSFKRHGDKYLRDSTLACASVGGFEPPGPEGL
jgi:hypothetical protein